MKKIIIPFLLILILCSCVAGNPRELDPLNAYINGEPVSWEEIFYFEEKHRSEVLSEFIFEHGAQVDENFWETPVNGKTPQEHLDKIVKQEILKSKIQLILCRENKIYENISIENFYALKEAYTKTFAEHGTIGINKIPDDTYYDYYIDNGIMELKNILEKSTLAPTEDELQYKMISVKEKYPDKTEDEQLSITKDILVEEKYDAYIEKLCNEAEVDWGSFN